MNESIIKWRKLRVQTCIKNLRELADSLEGDMQTVDDESYHDLAFNSCIYVVTKIFIGITDDLQSKP
jgi:hypothetical protein